MPRQRVTCLKCGHGWAVCVLIPNSSQSFVEAKLMCTRVQDSKVACGHQWILSSKLKIDGESVGEKPPVVSKREEDMYD